MIEFKTDTTQLNRALQRLANETHQDLGVVMRQTAKGVLDTAISLTPPGAEGRPLSRSRKAGQNRVEGDIRKVMIGVPRSKATSTVPAEIHRAHRNRYGRTRRARPRKRVPKGDLTRHIRHKKQNVGYLAGGWNEAALKLGAKVPAWVRNQPTPGHVILSFTRRRLYLKATNAAQFADGVEGMRRRVAWAVKSQTGKLRKRVDYILRNKTARRAGFRTR